MFRALLGFHVALASPLLPAFALSIPYHHDPLIVGSLFLLLNFHLIITLSFLSVNDQESASYALVIKRLKGVIIMK